MQVIIKHINVTTEAIRETQSYQLDKGSVFCEQTQDIESLKEMVSS